MELLLLVGSDRRVTYCSGGGSIIRGLRPDQVLGRGLSELLQDGLSFGCSADSLDSVLTLVSDSAETARAVEMSSIAPFPQHYLVTVFPPFTAQNGTTTGITIKDVTAAREAEVRKGKSLSQLADQLRDPVTALMGFTRLLLDSPSVEGNERYWLENVQTCGQLLTAIAQDMLEVAALNSGNLSTELEDVSLNDALGEGPP